MKRDPFPWDAVMHAGLVRLRLSPADFWSMTPRELAAALRPNPDPNSWAEPPRRTTLEKLMTIYPDTNNKGQRS
ncbi:MAG: rcc01693 family protein [Pseudomonadota bacterium]